MTEQSSEKTDINGRNKGGLFAKGNKFGNGRPKIDKDAATLFYRALNSTVSEEDITEILQKMVKDAKRGDVPMIKLLLAYYAGEPTQNINSITEGSMLLVVEHARVENNNP